MTRRQARASTLTDPHEEAPALTDAQLAELRPAYEVHSLEEFAALTAVRRRERPVEIAGKIEDAVKVPQGHI